MQTNTTTVEPKREVFTTDFGNGRYSNAMKELFQDSQRLLGIDAPQAAKLAQSFGADLGRYNATAKIAFGKVSKDGKMTLRESCTIKGVTVTYAISLAKLCVIFQEAYAYGADSFKVTLEKNFIDWLNK